MNISTQIFMLAAKAAEKIIEEGKEVGPGLASALRNCAEKVGEALELTPEVRGWDLGGNPPEVLFKKGPFVVKWDMKLYSEKGEYILVNNGKYLITMTFGDFEVEKGMSCIKGVKPLLNKKAQELWEENEENENED